MRADNPSAVYRAYRRQAVYALFRLFDDALPADAVLQPEGLEDLAIYDADGALMEIVQVKDRASNLTASSFKSSFYKRIADHCSPESTTIVTIASFGPIGPELRHAKSGLDSARRRTLETISKTGVTDSQASAILDHVTLSQVKEADLINRIKSVLAHVSSAISPTKAFEFLMWWILTSSEVQHKIDRKMAIKKLTEIGKFLAERAAYHDEWYQSLIPLEDDASNRDTSRLAKEFYRGGRVRFDHVTANLDVRRDKMLNQIHASFSEAKVVVIHSASGQGKTTLAYRYLNDFAPSDFRFEALRSDDLRHARSMAIALTAHSSALTVPSIVFVDVSPGDLNWIELVKGLASKDGIRVLVTVREEDWRRSNVRATDFHYEEIILEFDKSEAAQMYAGLGHRTTSGRHLDFEDAWSQFGGRKTLIEFIYFVTQEETLSDRVRGQIAALLDSSRRGECSPVEIDLLRAIAVVSAYEARLDIAKLVTIYDLPEPMRTINLFEDEYLARVTEDGQYVEGFHAIRSEIMCEELCDTVVNTWCDVVARCLPALVEDDLERFLLCTFSRRQSVVPHVLNALLDFQPRSWTGMCGILRALMWQGLTYYVAANQELIDEARRKVSVGWWFWLDWDLAQANRQAGPDSLESLMKLDEGRAEIARSLQERQSDKNAVFVPLTSWLSICTQAPCYPRIAKEWLAMSEVLFWIGHLKIATPVANWFPKEGFTAAVNALQIHLVGNFVRGVRECYPGWYEEWLADHRLEISDRIRREASIVRLDENSEAIVGHFIIELDPNASALHRDQADETGERPAIHHLTLERIQLLNCLFPGKQRYGAVGYGHRMSLMPSEYDEGDMPGVLADEFHPYWIPRFNAIALGLVELQSRPASWREFLARFQEARKNLLECFADLRKSITSILKKKQKLNSNPLSRPQHWKRCIAKFDDGFPLPRSAVDEWGFVGESLAKSIEKQELALRYTVVSRLQELHRAINEYTRTVQNFMRQVVEGLAILRALRAAPDENARKQVRDNVRQSKFSEKSIRLSMINGVAACKALRDLEAQYSQLAEIGKGSTIDDVVGGEYSRFCETVDAWCRFVTQPKTLMLQKSQRSRKRKRKERPYRTALPFEWFLKPIRSHVQECLAEMNEDQIQAGILTESVRWNQDDALWITCDVRHPAMLLTAPQLLWKHLRTAFEPYVLKMPHNSIVGLTWPRIVIVPLVQGKSLEQQALPNFCNVTYPQEITQSIRSWNHMPEPIPQEAWEELGLGSWQCPHRAHIFDEFLVSCVSTFHHLDHLSDLARVDGDLDALGAEIIQSYVDREMARIQPITQAMFDLGAEALKKVNAIPESEFNRYPNLLACLELLKDLGNAVLPTTDFDGKATLMIEDVRAWRDRLSEWLGQLNFVRHLWIADCLGFPEFDFDRIVELDGK